METSDKFDLISSQWNQQEHRTGSTENVRIICLQNMRFSEARLCSVRLECSANEQGDEIFYPCSIILTGPAEIGP